MNGIYSAAGDMIVGQFHDVIKVLVSPSDMQDVDEPVMCPRDGLECGHALEFTQERAFIFESVAINHFHSAPGARQTAGEPNFTVSAATDHTHDFVIGN